MSILFSFSFHPFKNPSCVYVYVCGVFLFCLWFSSFVLIIKLFINKQRKNLIYVLWQLFVGFFFLHWANKKYSEQIKGRTVFRYIGLSNTGRRNGIQKGKSNKYMQHQTCKVSNTKTTSKLESFHLPTRVTL